MAKYPEKPTRVSGYTEKWIEAYFENEATDRQINKYRKAISEIEALKDRKQIFYDMFIAKKPKKAKAEKKTFDERLKELEKKKRDAKKAQK